MKQRLFIVVAMIALSLCAWGETPAEAYRKHPVSLCLFFKTPAFGGDLKNFDIERVAFYTGDKPRVYIKLANRSTDIVKYVSDTMKSDEYSIGLIFEDGSALAVDADVKFMAYMSTKKQFASFLIDEYRCMLYEDILKKEK